MNRSHGAAIASLLFAAAQFATEAAAHAADDRFTLLGDLPGSWDASFANGVSSDGAFVVGGSWGASGFEAFKWSAAEGMVGLGALPGGLFNSTATGVSDDGMIIVGYDDIGNERSRAVRWEGGPGPIQLTLCDDCPDQACSTIVYGLSADGSRAAGLCGFIPTGDFQAVRWEGKDGITELGNLVASVISPDGTVIAGTDRSRTGWIWRDGEEKPTSLGELAPGGHSEPWGVSADGNTACGHAGIFPNGVYTEVPFVWTREGGMRQIDMPLASPLGNAWGITADGSTIIGVTPCDCPGGFSAWIWTEETGARLLDQVASNDFGIDLGNMHLAFARAISPDGQWIAGNAHANEPGVFDLAMRLRLVRSCPPDLDHNGALDLFDFLAFGNLFNAADPAADCDANAAFDLFDFLCFTNAFNAGC